MSTGLTAAKRVGVGMIALMVLAGCAAPFGLGTSPYAWVQERYSHVSGDDPDDGPVTFTSDKPVTEVVGAIVGGTDPDEVKRGSATSSAGMVADSRPMNAHSVSGAAAEIALHVPCGENGV